MNDERVFQLLIEVNPVPSSGGLDSPVTHTTHETGREAMVEAEVSTPAHSVRPSLDPRRQRRLRAGAIAAALVVAVGGLWAFVNSRTGDPVAAAMDVASIYLEARNAYDADTALAVMAPDVVLDEIPRIHDRDEVEPIFDWMRRQGIVISTYECAATTPGPVIDVECDYEAMSRLTRLVGHPPLGGKLVFEVSEGQLVSIVNEPDPEDFRSYSREGYGAFVRWLQLNYPGAYDTIYIIEDDGLAVPILTDEALDLMEGYLDEFEASKSSTPG